MFGRISIDAILFEKESMSLLLIPYYAIWPKLRAYDKVAIAKFKPCILGMSLTYGLFYPL
jgi:hypothetical protein